MNTEQNYVGGGNYASPSHPPRMLISFRQQTNQLIEQIAQLSGESPEEIWQRIYDKLHAFYQVDVRQFPRHKNESLLSVAERYDLLDKVYQVASAELLHLQTDR